MSSGSVFRRVIYVPATETYYRKTASASSSLIAQAAPKDCVEHSMSTQTFPI